MWTEMLVVLLHEMCLEGEYFGRFAEKKAGNLSANHSNQERDLPRGDKVCVAAFVEEVLGH